MGNGFDPRKYFDDPISPTQDAFDAESYFLTEEEKRKRDELNKKRSRDVPGALIDIPGNVVGTGKALVDEQSAEYERALEGPLPESAGLASIVAPVVKGAVGGFQSLVEGGVGGALGGLADMATNIVKSPITLGAWAAKKLGVDVENSPIAQIAGVATPEQRYDETSLAAETAIGMGVAYLTHQRLVSGNYAAARQYLDLPRNATKDQIFAAMETVDPAIGVAARNSVGKGAKWFLERATKEGAVGGVASALVNKDLQYSENPFDDVMSYAIAGSVLGLAFEGALRPFGVRSEGSRVHKRMDFELGLAQAQILPVDKAKLMSKAIMDGADPVTAFVEQMDEFDSAIITLDQGLDPTRVVARNKDYVAAYKNESGQYTLLIRGKGFKSDVVHPKKPSIEKGGSVDVEIETVKGREPQKVQLKHDIFTPDELSMLDNAITMADEYFTNEVDAARSDLLGKGILDSANKGEYKLIVDAEILREIKDQLDLDIDKIETVLKDEIVLESPTKLTERQIESRYRSRLNKLIKTKDAIVSKLDNLIKIDDTSIAPTKTKETIPVTPAKPTKISRNPLLAAHLNQFRNEGFFHGMEINVLGQEMIFDRFSNKETGRVRVIDPVTGKASVVDKTIIARPNAPKIRTVDRLVYHGQGEKPATGYLTTSEFQTRQIEGLQALLDELPDEFKPHMDAANEYASNQALVESGNLVADVNALGYLIAEGGDGVTYRIIDTQSGATVAEVKGADGLKAFTVDKTLPISGSELVGKIHEKLGINQRLAAAGSGIKHYEGGVKRGALFDLYNKAVTSFLRSIVNLNVVVSAFDNKLGTKLSPRLYALRRSIMEGNAAREPFAKRFGQLKQSFKKLPKEQQALAHKYIETMSYADWMTRGVFGVKPSNNSLKFVHELTADGITTEHRVNANKYVTEFGWIQDKYIDPKTKQVPEAKLEAYNKELAYITEKYNAVEPEVTKAIDILLKIERNFDPLDVSRVEVLKGAEVRQDGGLSRKDFAIKNKIAPEMAQILHSWEAVMRVVGEQVGVDPKLLITGYFPHYNKYTPTKSVNWSLDKVGRDTPQVSKDFKSKLIRTGFFSDAEIFTDLFDVTQRYLDAAFYSKHREVALNEFGKAVDEEIKKLRPDGTGPKFTGEQIEGLRDLKNKVEVAARGHLAPLDALAAYSAEQFNTAISKQYGKDWIGHWMKFMESKAQGYKLMAGIRDGTSMTMMYGMQFGPHRAANLMRVAKLAVEHKEALAASGRTPTLEPTMIREGGRTEIGSGGATEGTGTASPYDPRAMVREKLKATTEGAIDYLDPKFEAFVDKGFEWSLQPIVYKTGHALAYIETTDWVGRYVTEFAAGRIDEARLKKQISLALYDDATVAEFDAFMKSGTYKEAIDLLAQRAGDIVIGEYSRMTAPIFFQSKMGKVLGQFTRWPLWGIGAVGRGLTHGSGKGIAARTAFMASTYILADKIANESGIDLKSWVINPIQWFPLGSPPYQAVAALAEAMERSGASSAADYNQFKHGLEFMINPIPIAFLNAIEAAARYDEGQPPEVVLFRAMGGRINSQKWRRPSLWD